MQNLKTFDFLDIDVAHVYKVGFMLGWIMLESLLEP